jgi:lysophospholipase L1-like esterase
LRFFQENPMTLAAGDVILFQGDSITDCGRSREKNTGHTREALGEGYPLLAAGLMLSRCPGLNLAVINRGISGNKVVDLPPRWKADALDLKPTVVSILIGVNDTWHSRAGWGAAVPLDLYEATYRALLTDTRAALPQVRLVLCEPFVLRVGAVTDAWFPEIDQRRAVVRKLAGEYGAVFVPFQRVLNRAVKDQPRPEYWLADGVHPTLAGHALLAQAFVKAVG